MPKTKLNTNQLGGDEVVFSQSSLRSGKNIELVRKANPYVIDDHTLAVWNFEDPETWATSSYGNYTITQMVSGTHERETTYKKFGGAAYYAGKSGTGGSGGSGSSIISTPISGNVTIDFWMMTTKAYYYQDHRSCTLNFTGSSVNFDEYLTNGGRLNVYNGTSTVTVIEPADNIRLIPMDNTFHHYVFERDATSKKLYFFLDGILRANVDITPNVSDLATTIKFTSGDSCRYAIDEIRVSDMIRWYPEDAPFPTPDEPYAASATSDWYVINNTQDISGKLDASTAASTYLTQSAAASTYATQSVLAGKQDALTAGEGIDITNNVISATATGGSATLVEGDNIVLTEESDESGEVVTVVSAPDVWTQSNLVAGKDISITQVQKPEIDVNTTALFHFDNSFSDELGGADFCGYSSFDVSRLSSNGGQFDGYVLGGNYYFEEQSSYTEQGRVSFYDKDSFTIDMWVKCSSTSDAGVLNFIAHNSSSLEIRFTRSDFSYSASAGKLWINKSLLSNTSESGSYEYSVGTTFDSWAHLAFVQDASAMKRYVFVNGEIIASATYTSNYPTVYYTRVYQFGKYLSMDELRYSNVARWTSDFTPFTAPYSAATGVTQYQINNTKSSELPSQTGNSGKYLTTDGTSASWATVSGLQNTATASSSVGVLSNTTSSSAVTGVGVSATTSSAYSTGVGYLANATGSNGSVAIGAFADASGSYSTCLGGATAQNYQTKASGSASTAIGHGCGAFAEQSVAVGSSTFARVQGSTALGYLADAAAQNAMQLGEGRNNTATTLQFRSTQIVNASGKIPTASIDFTGITGYDATKTQVLKHVQGALQWVDEVEESV